jgi:hypothetical protein
MTGRFDYTALLSAATFGVVRRVLADVAEHGLEGDHHLFLTFRTGDPGVRVPATLARRYPETMTIVLQHQFVDLEVDEQAFAVTLRFGGAWERVRVPYDALATFVDPSVPFGLDLTSFTGASAGDGTAAAGEPPKSGPVAAPEPGREVDALLAPSASESVRESETEPAAGDLLPFRRR